MTSDERPRARVITARQPLAQRIVMLWRYRDLIVAMSRKELKVKYKNSILGFVWSMLNPALYLVVFYIVFQLVLKNGMPAFAIFLLSGLLVWNLFSAALSGATTSITGNGSLVKKVYFPREVLPLASIGAALVHFFLQSIVLLGAVVIFRYQFSPVHSLLLIPALVVLLCFTAAVGVLLGAINVYLRDTQHLLEIVLLVWFWMTPIVYQFRLMSDRLGSRAWIVYLNPVTSITLAFQRAIYNKAQVKTANGVMHILPDAMGVRWYLVHLGGLAVVSAILFVVGLAVFGRLEANFAEEL